MDATISPYRTSDPPMNNTCLRQGEILSNILTIHRVVSDLPDESQYNEISIPLGIIITQDCDLEQDYNERGEDNHSTSDKIIPSVLLARVYLAEEVKERSTQGKNDWKSQKIAINNNPRFHFMDNLSPEQDQMSLGIAEMTIDFKSYFTIPTDDLYDRVQKEETKRRCVLVSPYLEHLSHRFAYYLSRVGLPRNYRSE